MESNADKIQACYMRSQTDKTAEAFLINRMMSMQALKAEGLQMKAEGKSEDEIRAMVAARLDAIHSIPPPHPE